MPGEKTVLGRNPYYFGVDKENKRLPYLDEIVFLIVPDLDAADLKFRAGELHGLDDVKPENYNWYQDNQQKGNFTLYDLGPDLNTNHFWFNLNKVQKPTPGKKMGEPFVDPVKYAWFSNPTFRRAVSLAIDRDAMIPSVFFGEAVKSWAIATPGNKVWHSPDLLRFDYNPAEAKKLLAGHGLERRQWRRHHRGRARQSRHFSLKTNSSNTTRIAMMNFIKADLAKVGINVITAPVDFNTLITNLRSDFQYDAMLLGLQSGVPPDPTMMQNVWRSTGLTHSWFLDAGEARHAAGGAHRSADGRDPRRPTTSRERKKAYKEVETIANEMAWMTWLPVRAQKIPGEQPVRQHPAEHPPPSDSMELVQHLRQMTRALPVLSRLLVVVLLAAIAVTGCRRRAAEVAEYTDPHPLCRKIRSSSMRRRVGKHGGRFVFALTSNPRTFNAMMANETSTTDITDHNLFTYLVHYDNAKQQQIPMIAKSWEVSADGLTWTFHLRRGAKFSDGHPITSADVLFSAQVALDETLHPAVQDQLKLNGKPFEFSAPDPHTVVIKTQTPFATMLDVGRAR